MVVGRRGGEGGGAEEEKRCVRKNEVLATAVALEVAEVYG
jgi:hypothetical protein